MEALKLSGMTNRDIARCSGLNEATIRRLLVGQGEHVYPQTARAVMAVRPNSVAWRADQAWVNPIGTVRRVQALIALGHSRMAISRRAGMADEWAARFLRSPSNVEEQTRVKVARAFDEMCLEIPTGPYVARTKNYARRAGFFPPFAWDDDIDDPAAVPNDGTELVEGEDMSVVDAAIDGARPMLTLAERAEVVTVLNERRWSARQIAEHLGVSEKTIERDRKRLGLPVYLRATDLRWRPEREVA